MKTLHLISLSFALLFSVAVSANSILARYDFATQVHGMIEDQSPIAPYDFFLIHRIELTVDGKVRLSVKEQRFLAPIESSSFDSKHFVTLNEFPINMNLNGSLILSLGDLMDVEVKKTMRSRPCELYVSPEKTVNHLYVYDESSEQLQLIQTPSGCWVSEQVSPVRSEHSFRANLFTYQLLDLYFQ